MSAHEHEDEIAPVELSDDDVAYLLSLLRDPSKTQPVTTQDLINALRHRTGR
jgi:hypothetical protein